MHTIDSCLQWSWLMLSRCRSMLYMLRLTSSEKNGLKLQTLFKICEWDLTDTDMRIFLFVLKVEFVWVPTFLQSRRLSETNCDISLARDKKIINSWSLVNHFITNRKLSSSSTRWCWIWGLIESRCWDLSCKSGRDWSWQAGRNFLDGVFAMMDVLKFL